MPQDEKELIISLAVTYVSSLEYFNNAMLVVSFSIYVGVPNVDLFAHLDDLPEWSNTNPWRTQFLGRIGLRHWNLHRCANHCWASLSLHSLE